MTRSIAPHRPDPARYGGAQRPPKHLEVLRVAMRLIAERGYRGASLRELARRVGMQQPSLYHYFRSKEDLVEQILVTFGFGGALMALVVSWIGLGAVALTQFGMKPYPRRPRASTPSDGPDADKLNTVLGTLPPEEAAA